MPWCDACDRFLSPNTVNDDGTCPECGSRIISAKKLDRARRGRGASIDADESRHARTGPERGDAGSDAGTGRAQTNAGHDADDQSTPWHFKVLLVALVLYLTWRLVQGILWVAHKL
ncbi:MAG: zinc-ribbon domain-containing protein [Actinobacteria bacterium]|nr:zinc-ribbon domain-containing protein [Actinomycetota bacterium]